MSKLFEKLKRKDKTKQKTTKKLKRLKPIMEVNPILSDINNNIIGKSLEEKKVCLAIFLDVAEAFD